MEERHGLYVVGIVAIIAIVALVILIIGNLSGNASQISSSADKVGQAYYIAPPITYGYGAANIACAITNKMGNVTVYLGYNLKGVTALNMTSGGSNCITKTDIQDAAQALCSRSGIDGLVSSTVTAYLNYGCKVVQNYRTP